MLEHGFNDLPPRVRERLRRDFPFYAGNCLYIRGTDGALISFKEKKTQRFINQRAIIQLRTRGYVRALVLKARQQGVSTLISARAVFKTTQNIGFKTFILTHLSSATQNVLDMAYRYIQNMPVEVKPALTAANRNQIRFGGLDSMFTVGTARNKDSGRSETVQFIHASEAGFYPWPEEIAKGLNNAIHRVAGTEMWMETTADGMETWLHKLWQQAAAGESELEAIFCPWHWEPTYRLPVPADFEPTPEEIDLIDEYGLDYAQVMFRRNYIATWGISAWRTEMPATPEEAFQGAIIDGRVYPAFSKTRNVTACNYDPEEIIYVGMDFNVAPMSAALFHLAGGQIHQFDEVVMTDADTEMMAAEIKRRYPDAKHQIVCFPDPAGKARKTSAKAGRTDFSILREAGFEVIAPRAHDPVRDRINTVNRAIKGPHNETLYFVDPRCVETIKCMSRVRYVEGSKNTVNKREGLDHMPDAVGYAIMQLLPITGTGLVMGQVKGY